MNDISIFRYVDATHHIQPGETVFKAGDSPDFMYYVKSGTLHIERNDETIAVVEAGSVVGEMALIDSAPRSATVRAITLCHLIAIDEEGFIKHINGTPRFVLYVMEIAVNRLRSYLHKDLQEK